MAPGVSTVPSWCRTEAAKVVHDLDPPQSCSFRGAPQPLAVHFAGRSSVTVAKQLDKDARPWVPLRGCHPGNDHNSTDASPTYVEALV